ncbi:MAG: chemotaxis response regulator protein-glutamate methylesterase [Elusimicrobiota bacterium]
MINVFLIDDSKFILNAVSKILEKAPDIRVVGMASDGLEAVSKVVELNPDVITLDIAMYPVDGLTVLKRIMEKNPTPVIIFSGDSKQATSISIEALKLGAVDYVAKPGGGESPLWMKASLNQVSEELITKIRIAATVDRERLRTLYRFYTDDKDKKDIKKQPVLIQPKKVIAIGSSTGGPQALMEILTGFHDDFGSVILVSQHMPPFFIKRFSERLNSLSRLCVKVAEEGDVLQAGMVFFAPGEYNLLIEKKKKKYIITLNNERGPNYKRLPCIDIMMESVARAAGEDSIGVLLSGMGRDGAEGMEVIKSAGGTTVVQDEATSVVFGMPKEAIKKGVVDKILPLKKIAGWIIRNTEESDD